MKPEFTSWKQWGEDADKIGECGELPLGANAAGTERPSPSGAVFSTPPLSNEHSPIIPPPEPREPAREWLKKQDTREWDNHEQAEIVRLLAAYSAELRAERDAAVEMLRVLMEETILAGYPGGDRNQTLANVRNMKRSLLQARLVIEAARCIRHWHDSGRNNEGMIVSSEHVRKLWEALGKYDELLASTSAPEGT